MTTTTCEHTYQGWSTRETWRFLLIVTNDYGLYTAARDQLINVPDYQRTDTLRDWADTVFTRRGYVNEYGIAWPDEIADMANEIGSLDRINWIEATAALTPDE